MTVSIRLVLVLFLLSAPCALSQSPFNKLSFTILNHPSPGYYLVEPNSADSIGFMDNTGVSVCKTFVGGHANVQTHNDTYITHLASSNNTDFYFLRRDRFFNVIDTMRPTSEYVLDFHEGKVWSDSSYLVLASETRVVDMSTIVAGGNTAANVIGAVIQERRFSDGMVVFEWKSLDHIPVTDATDDIVLTNNLIDYIHVNSVWKDVDDNLIVSCRHTDEVIKIKKSTGTVLWRLGGSGSRGNQFTFINDTFNDFDGFSHQHSAIRTKAGNILLFDNGNLRPAPNYARAVEYALDTVLMTATRVWIWQPTEGVVATSQGSVQELDNGNILIGWGSGSSTYIAHEVRRDGTIEVEIKNETGASMIPYRVSKMRIGATGVERRIATVGTHTFSRGDSTTHVKLSLNSIADSALFVVERHHYAPHDISYTVDPLCEALPIRWTIRSDARQSIGGVVVFDVGSIPVIQYPEMMRIYHRPIEGQGAFQRLNGAYSAAARTFTTGSFIEGEFLVGYADCFVPEPIEPPQSAREVSTTPTLKWLAALNAERYDVQVSNTEDFSALFYTQTTANLEADLPAVQENTTLYWRVRKVTSSGVGPWSATFRFTVVMGIPQLLTPVMEDDTVAVLNTAEFRWVPGIGAPKSRLQITSLASNTVVVDTIVDEPRFIPGSKLRPHTWYSWNVRGWADNVNGRPSVSQTFITAVASPRLRGPGANVTGVPPLKTTFIWDSVVGAEGYTVIIRRASDTSVVAIQESTTPSVVVYNLPSVTKLTWTCRGNSTYGPGLYAVATAFTTAASSSLPAPKTVSPRGGSVVDSSSVVLRWSEVYGANAYDVQFSTNPAFSSDVSSRFDLTQTQTTIGPLHSATPYYWRVLGRSAFATGTWSDTAVFVTNAPPEKGLVPHTPPTAEIDVPVNGAVTYSTSSLYTSYRVEFSKSPTFDPIVSTFVSSNGTCEYRDLERESTYFWRVRGSRTGAPTDVGSASFFTTLRNDVVSVDHAQEKPAMQLRREGTSLRVDGVDANTDVVVRILDLQGRLLAHHLSSHSSSVSVDLSHLLTRQLIFVYVSTGVASSLTSSMLW